MAIQAWAALALALLFECDGVLGVADCAAAETELKSSPRDGEFCLPVLHERYSSATYFTDCRLRAAVETCLLRTRMAAVSRRI